MPSFGSGFMDQNCDSNIQFELLLCWVSMGNVYAETKVVSQVHIPEGYDSQYTVVHKKSPCDKFFADKDAFDQIVDKGERYYPVQREDETVDGDDIVILKPYRILPRYVVQYSVKEAIKVREAIYFVNTKEIIYRQLPHNVHNREG